MLKYCIEFSTTTSQLYQGFVVNADVTDADAATLPLYAK